LQGNHSSSSKKKYVDPNMVFPFQDDFSVGTILGTNITPANSRTAPAASEAIKIADDNDKISILTLKSLAENGNLLPAEESRSEHVVGNRVASRSNQNLSAAQLPTLPLPGQKGTFPPPVKDPRILQAPVLMVGSMEGRMANSWL
jgi:hypothetical protein